MTVPEGKPLSLGSPSVSDLHLTAAADGSVTATSGSGTRGEIIFASGKRQPLDLPAPAAATELKGPWNVVLNSPVDETRKLVLPELENLADHVDPAVKYFSGTATYSLKFDISNLKSPMTLDLGKVHDLAPRHPQRQGPRRALAITFHARHFLRP